MLEGDHCSWKRDFALKYFEPDCNVLLSVPKSFPWLCRSFTFSCFGYISHFFFFKRSVSNSFCLHQVTSQNQLAAYFALVYIQCIFSTSVQLLATF